MPDGILIVLRQTSNACLVVRIGFLDLADNCGPAGNIGEPACMRAEQAVSPASNQGVILKLFKVDEEHPGRLWFLRIATLVAMVALVAVIGVFFRRGDAVHAILLLAAVPVLAALFSLGWTGSLFTSLDRAKRYVQGAEGAHRHEWYVFKGQRVRVFLDDMEEPWFALNDIAFILALKVVQSTFRHYGPREYGTPASASEPCLSESGLRRLIKYSRHPDAGALGNWLERDVLRMLRNRQQNRATDRRL